MRLKNKVSIITGAAQGIGEACARRLAREGAAVALWDVADAPGQALAAELQARGDSHDALSMMVSSMARMVQAGRTSDSRWKAS